MKKRPKEPLVIWAKDVKLNRVTVAQVERRREQWRRSQRKARKARNENAEK